MQSLHLNRGLNRGLRENAILTAMNDRIAGLAAA
jgi:hypothetical protein